MRRARGALAAAGLSLLGAAVLWGGGAPTAGATAPAVTIEAASSVRFTTAKLKGTVNPEDKQATYRFQYVTQAQFEDPEPGKGQWAQAASTPTRTLAAGSGLKAAEESLASLKPATNYHLRLVAESADGKVEAVASTFETEAVALPSVSALSVSAITATSAHFSATVNPNSPEAAPASDPAVKAAYEVSWSLACEPAPRCPNPNLGGRIDEPGNAALPIAIDAAGQQFLQPNTEYHLTLVATNAAGSVEAAPISFTTPQLPPTASFVASTPLGGGRLGIGALLNPHNVAIEECLFEYGPDDSYGTTVPCEELPPTGNDPVPVRAELTDLVPGVAYHVRLSAGSETGGALGEDATVTLPATPTPPACANAGALGTALLADCRAWEMVSPPEKNGGYAVPNAYRTRAAADGSAVGFISLAAFGDAIGTGVATDYLAQRSADPNPGDSGWSTHAITPAQETLSLPGIFSVLEPHYPGEFSSNLERGVFFAKSPLTADPYVEPTVNLYRREDLRSPGSGDYSLLSSCPRCELTGVPLPELDGTTADFLLRPTLVGSSPDLSHLAFESQLRLTVDTPPATGHDRLFEWGDGTLRLAGRIPTGAAISCDDDGGPACVAASDSIGGAGADGNQKLTPHTVSDGADGQRRVFFTVPTTSSGSVKRGNVYARLDGHATIKLNASERDAEPEDEFAPAQFWDATADGARALFTTAQALTDDAPANGRPKLYMYDLGKPASAPDNLTFLSVDREDRDGDATVGEPDLGLGVIGIGGEATDPHVYFTADSQLVPGGPRLGGGDRAIYLWHDGQLREIATLHHATSSAKELISTGPGVNLSPRQARLSPDGVHLLFSSVDGEGLLSHYGGMDYDQGPCVTDLGQGCRELYLYDAEVNQLRCVSCSPGGHSATVDKDEMSGVVTLKFQSGSKPGSHESHALSDDGRYVFFSTAQKLVPSDTNGVVDAYLYDAATGERRLLSSGEDAKPSFFLDSSADGSNAFFATAERLSGWDVDTAYDLYDARVGGGFPEPSPPPPSCAGDACQPPPVALNDPTPASAAIRGPGNPESRAKAKAKRRCPKGKRRVKGRRGKSRCVKRKRAKQKRHRKHRRANHDRRKSR